MRMIWFIVKQVEYHPTWQLKADPDVTFQSMIIVIAFVIVAAIATILFLLCSSYSCFSRTSWCYCIEGIVEHKPLEQWWRHLRNLAPRCRLSLSTWTQKSWRVRPLCLRQESLFQRRCQCCCHHCHEIIPALLLGQSLDIVVASSCFHLGLQQWHWSSLILPALHNCILGDFGPLLAMWCYLGLKTNTRWSVVFTAEQWGLWRGLVNWIMSTLTVAILQESL